MKNKKNTVGNFFFLFQWYKKYKQQPKKYNNCLINYLNVVQLIGQDKIKIHRKTNQNFK